MGWLYRISSNIFYDYHNSQNQKSNLPDFYLNDIKAEIDNIAPEKLLTQKEMTELIMGKLSLKEKEVVITDIEYKRSQKYLPPDVLDELANKLNIKPASVRKIRERAIKKIKLAIDEING